MAESVEVYDLGEVSVGSKPRPAATAAAPRRVRRPSATSHPTGRPHPAVTSSLSLFVPGLGQMVAGEPVAGLFYASAIACVATVARALVVSLDRILPTLDLIEIPRVAAGIALGVLAIAAASLHLASVSSAYASTSSKGRSAAHPVVTGLASAIVPGWGQLLVGHRARAAFFLASLWIAAAGWALASPEGVADLRAIGLVIPASAKSGWGPVALITLPALTWALAVYDAAVGGIAKRR